MTAALFNACDYLLDRHVREGRGPVAGLRTTALGELVADAPDKVPL